MSLRDRQILRERADKLDQMLAVARAHEAEGQEPPEWVLEELTRLLTIFLDRYGV